MSSNYLTFGQFNNNEPQYQQNNYNMEESYNDPSYPPPQQSYPQQQQSKPQFSMPIRQHMPVYQRDRDPYDQQTSQSYPNVHLNPTSLMPYIPHTPPTQPQPPQQLYPSHSTPINEAFTENTPPQQNRPLIMSSCIDVNDHIVSCPICSKYYQNYTSVYIGIIILLGFIILIFLLKSILEVKRT